MFGDRQTVPPLFEKTAKNYCTPKSAMKRAFRWCKGLKIDFLKRAKHVHFYLTCPICIICILGTTVELHTPGDIPRTDGREANQLRYAKTRHQNGHSRTFRSNPLYAYCTRVQQIYLI